MNEKKKRGEISNDTVITTTTPQLITPSDQTEHISNQKIADFVCCVRDHHIILTEKLNHCDHRRTICVTKTTNRTMQAKTKKSNWTVKALCLFLGRWKATNSESNVVIYEIARWIDHHHFGLSLWIIAEKFIHMCAWVYYIFVLKYYIIWNYIQFLLCGRWSVYIGRAVCQLDYRRIHWTGMRYDRNNSRYVKEP